VKLLLDTHIVLWAAGQPDKLSESAKDLLTTSDDVLFFSAVSIWEIVIKRSLGRKDFGVDPRRLRKMLITHGYHELAVISEHTLAVDGLPLLHKDPFDRLLIAQAQVEGMRLLTVDANVLRYEGAMSAGQ
jgi:PIN domain nuclease of toxin-antitoxin system